MPRNIINNRGLATATPLPILPNRYPGLVCWLTANRGLVTDGAANCVAASFAYLYIDPAPASFATFSACTFAGWVKLTSLPGNATLVGKRSGATTDYLLRVNSGTSKVDWALSSSGGSPTASSTTALSTGIWYFVCATWNGATLGISVNNETPVTQAGSTLSNAVTQVGFGAYTSASQNLNGSMDAWGFWTRALTAAEITQLYNGGNGLAVKEFSGSLLTNLVSGYDFDSTTNLTKDYIGSNTLTNQNTTCIAGQVSSSILIDGDVVTTWRDQSGNGNNVTQATIGNRPTYKTGIQNGLPIVRFDGLSTYLKTTSSRNFPTGTSARSMFATCSAALNGGQQLPFTYSDATGSGTRQAFALSLFGTTGGPDTAIAFTSCRRGLAGALSSGINEYTAIYPAGQTQASAVQMWRNGTSLTLSQVAGADGTINTLADLVAVGGDGVGTSLLTGDICEIILVNREMTTTQRLFTENYLRTTWGTT